MSLTVWPREPNLDPGALPSFSKQGVIVSKPSGMPTAGPYSPQLLAIRRWVPGFPYRYVLFFTTDHDTGEGGIWLYVSNHRSHGWISVDDSTIDATNPIHQTDSLAGEQIETFKLIRRPTDGQLLGYYHKESLGLLQSTVVVDVADDLITFTGEQQVLPNPDQQADELMGKDHYGYARPFTVGSKIGMHHLAGALYHALSWSEDGKEFVTEYHPLSDMNPFLLDGVARKLGNRQVVWWPRGGRRLMAINTKDRTAMGGSAGNPSIALAECSQDYRQPISRPVVIADVGSTGYDDDGLDVPHFEADYDGSLMCAYTAVQGSANAVALLTEDMD